MEARLKELASWLAEKPSASTAELFVPLAELVKALEKAHLDNARDAEAEKRKQQAAAAPAGPKKYGGRPGGMPLPGMGGAAPSNNMMLEMQLKMAQRAEKASFATGAAKSEIEQRQKQLIAQGQQVTRSSNKLDGGVGAELADGSKTGALFAQRRAQAALAAD